MEHLHISGWDIPGSDGKPIFGNTHSPKGETSGTLICCHGFKGYKDYGFLPLLCSRAAQAGLCAVRFNFSHSGMTNRIETFEHPELFTQDTWRRQDHDIQSILSSTLHESDSNVTGTNVRTPVVLFGHSRGGDSALLATGQLCSQDDWKPAGLITAAAPDYACNLDESTRQLLREDGRLLSPSGRTGQDLYVGRDWLEEIERDPDLYDPALAAAHVNCPTLIIHGSGDQTVPLEAAHNLHRCATPNSRLEIIDGASHVFDCPNPLPIDTPWEFVPEATRRLIDLTVTFAVKCAEDAR